MALNKSFSLSFLNNLFSKNNSTGIIEGENKLGLTQAQADLIVPQQLYTSYGDGNSNLQENFQSDHGTYYSMFPLAYRAASPSIYQNFCVEDYLITETKRTTSFIGSSNNLSSDAWWLRTGMFKTTSGAYIVYFTGQISTGNVICSSGVRPAMVMKLQ